jgi:hypothetical protein
VNRRSYENTGISLPLPHQNVDQTCGVRFLHISATRAVWRLSHTSLALAVRSYHGRLQAALHLFFAKYDWSFTTLHDTIHHHHQQLGGRQDTTDVCCLRNARSGPRYIFRLARNEPQSQTSSPCWPQKLTQLAVPNHFRLTSASNTCMCKSAPVTGRFQHGSKCLMFLNGSRYRD